MIRREAERAACRTPGGRAGSRLRIINMLVNCNSVYIELVNTLYLDIMYIYIYICNVYVFIYIITIITYVRKAPPSLSMLLVVVL